MSSDSLKLCALKIWFEVGMYLLQDKRDPVETGEKLQGIIDEKDGAKFEKDALKLQSDAVSRRTDILNRIKTATARGLVEWKPTAWDCGKVLAMRFQVDKKGISCEADAFWEQNLESKEYGVWRLRVYSKGEFDFINLSDDDSKFFTSVCKVVYAKKQDDEAQAIQSGFSSLPLA